MKNTIENIEFKSQDLHYTIIFHFTDGVKKSSTRISGQYENESDKEKFETQADWKEHFVSWNIQPDKDLEKLSLDEIPGINANITDYHHLIKESGEAVSTFRFVEYMLENL